MEERHRYHADELHHQPQADIGKGIRHQDQGEPKDPAQYHGGIHDRLEQPAFHDLEDLGCLSAKHRTAMIDHQSRQIE